MDIVLGVLIPFLGTTIGASMVFFMKNTLNKKVEKLLLGFASGVMIAASIWSLLIPAIDMAEKQGKIAWIPAASGFVLGILFLLIIDRIIPYFENQKDGNQKIKDTIMLILAVTLHNIPEGMAVGVVFAGLLTGSLEMSMAGAFALAIGIAIQNFPEGAIISLPLKCKGESKLKSFFIGMVSGIVEPISAFITILLTNFVIPILPYLLSFAAGAMIYVVVEELIPQSQKGEISSVGIIGVTFGFIVMMILDISLG